MANDVGVQDIPVSYVQWLRSVYKYIGPSGSTPDPRGVVTPADIAFEATNTRGVLGTIANKLQRMGLLGDEQVDAERTADAIQQANLLALRPPAQLTREPVPVRVSLAGTITPPSVTPTPPPETAPGPVQEPTEPPIDEFLRLLSMANLFGDITGALGEFSSILGNVSNIMGRPAQAQGFIAGPIARGVLGGAAGAGIFEGASNLLGFGGNGNGGPTALQRIKSDAGRNVTRRQVIAMARNCGLDIAASTLNTSVTNVCEVVSKGMPRRSRGISSRDMTRTRSTLSKLNTMQRSLSGICPSPRRRAPARRCK